MRKEILIQQITDKLPRISIAKNTIDLSYLIRMELKFEKEQTENP
jgi:hypothetical protein